jgi:hypothetical protein
MATKKKMQEGGSGKPKGKPSYDMRNAYDKKVQTNLTNSVSKRPTGSDYVGPYSIKGTAGPVNETVSQVRDIINSPVRPVPYQKKGGSTKSSYKTGGMVNANAKITAARSATGKVGGVTKAISKVAVKSASPKGRVGGISKAPKKALPKAQLGAIVKMAKTIPKIAKTATTAVKKAKAANYEKATANLKRSEDWDAYNQAKTAKKVGATMVGVPVAAAAVGSAMSDKPKSTSTKTSTSTSASKMLKSSMPKWMLNSLENKKRGGSKGKC